MLYSSLTNAELARWVYASPGDAAAVAELTSRIPVGLHGESDRLAEAEAEIAMLEEQQKGEMNASLADLHATEARLKTATAQITHYQAAMRRIVSAATSVKL